MDASSVGRSSVVPAAKKDLTQLCNPTAALTVPNSRGERSRLASMFGLHFSALTDKVGDTVGGNVVKRV